MHTLVIGKGFTVSIQIPSPLPPPTTPCVHSAAYYTLKECEEVKEQLAVKISDTNYKIGDKRKHLENLRKELKVLGEL